MDWVLYAKCLWTISLFHGLTISRDTHLQCGEQYWLDLAHIRPIQCFPDVSESLYNPMDPGGGGGYSHWQQYAYARMARVPFWHISVPLRVGVSSNVPQRVGFLTPNSVPERVWFFQSLCQKESRK